MAIALRSVGTVATAASATTLSSIGLPSGVASGDIMVMQAVARAAAATISGPAGWTQIGSQANVNSNHRMALFYKKAGGSETAPAITSDISANLAARIAAYSGCDGTTPIDATGSTSVQANNNLTAAAPTITTATDGAVVVWFFSTGGSATFSSYTAGVEAYQSNISGSFTHAMSSAYMTKATAGASGTSTVTSSSAANNWGLGVVALRPAAAAAATSPTFRAAGTRAATPSGTSVTPGLPAGLTAGDLMVLNVASQGSSATINTPTGWTSVAAQINPATTHRHRVFYKLAAVGETAPTVTATVAGPMIAVIAAWTGVDNLDPLAATSATNTSASGTTGTASALTTDTNGALAIYCWSTPTNNNVGTYSAGTEVVEVDGTGTGGTQYVPGPNRLVTTQPEMIGRVMGYILSDGSSTRVSDYGTTSNPSGGDFANPSSAKQSEFRRCLTGLGLSEGANAAGGDFFVRGSGNTCVNLATLATAVNTVMGTSVTKSNFLIGETPLGLPPGYTRVMVQAFLASIIETEAPAASSSATVKICDYNSATARDNTEAILDSEGLSCTQSGNDLNVNRAALDAFPMPLITPTDSPNWRYPSTGTPALWPETATTFDHTLTISTLADEVAGSLSAPTAQTSSSQTWGAFSLAIKPGATVVVGGKIPHPWGLADRQAIGNIPPSLVWITRQITWADIETSNGTYDWAELDATIEAADAAGAKVLIRSIGGVSSPDWVKALTGTVRILDQEHNVMVDQAKIWTATYMTHLKSFIDDIVARYDSDSRVLGFQAVGMNEVHGEPMVTWQNQVSLDNYAAAGYDYDAHRAAIIEASRYWAEKVRYSTVCMTFNGGWSTPRGGEGAVAARALVSDVCDAMLGENPALLSIQHHGFGLPWKTGGSTNEVGALYELMMAIRDAHPRKVTIDPQTTSTLQFVARAGFANAKAGMEWCVDTAEQYGFGWVEVPVDVDNYATTSEMNAWHDRIVASATAWWDSLGPPTGTTHALSGASTIDIGATGDMTPSTTTWALSGLSVLELLGTVQLATIGQPWASVSGLSVAVEVAFDATPLDTTPVWTDITAYVLSLETSRGRTSELIQGFPPGTMTVELDNTDRRFDPQYVAGPYHGHLLPMRQIRVRMQYAGTIYGVWHGYVQRWQQNRDANRLTVTVPAVDAFRLLSDMRMPENAQQWGIRSLSPLIYWPLSNNDGRDLSGNDYHAAVSFGFPAAAITPTNTSEVGATTIWSPGGVSAPIPQSGQVRTICAWLDINAANSLGLYAGTTAGNYVIVAIEPAQADSPGATSVVVDTSNSADNRTLRVANFQIQGPQGLHHFAVTVTQSAVSVYIDGQLAAARTPVAGTDTDLGMGRAGLTVSAGILTVADMAIWTTALTASQIAAIYTAGAVGYREDKTGARIARILDSAGWPATRRRIGGGHSYVAAWQPSQRQALEELRQVEASEQGRLFVGGDGWITFRDRGWNWLEAEGSEPQAIFGDDTTTGELPYLAVETSDADEDMIRNIVEVTTPAGTRTTTDTDSVAAYGDHLDTVTTHLFSPEMAANLGQYRTRKFGDPTSRITRLEVDPVAHPDLVPYVSAFDIGTRITVRRRPGSTALIEADYVIEAVDHAFDDVRWTVAWTLSPAEPSAVEGSYALIGDTAGPDMLIPF